MKKKLKKPFHVLHYVVDSTPKMRKFNSIKKLKKFVSDFEVKYPDDMILEGYWIDYSITNITGTIDLYDLCYDVEVD